MLVIVFFTRLQSIKMLLFVKFTFSCVDMQILQFRIALKKHRLLKNVRGEELMK